MADDRTVDQAHTDDLLLEAITLRCRAYGLCAEDEVVEQFLVAAFIDGMGLQERGSIRYVFCTRDSGKGLYATPPHSLQGLVVRAARWLEGNDNAGRA